MKNKILDAICSLLKNRDMCVLATVSNERPHCSLMAYSANERCDEIFMATLKGTNKYRNLKNNPRASLLVDTREEAKGGSPSNAKALTVCGIFEEIQDRDKAAMARGLLLNRHPHLKDLLDDPDGMILCIKIDSFLLLEDIRNPHFVTIRDFLSGRD